MESAEQLGDTLFREGIVVFPTIEASNALEAVSDAWLEAPERKNAPSRQMVVDNLGDGPLAERYRRDGVPMIPGESGCVRVPSMIHSTKIEQLREQQGACVWPVLQHSIPEQKRGDYSVTMFIRPLYVDNKPVKNVKRAKCRDLVDPGVLGNHWVRIDDRKKLIDPEALKNHIVYLGWVNIGVNTDIIHYYHRTFGNDSPVKLTDFKTCKDVNLKSLKPVTLQVPPGHTVLYRQDLAIDPNIQASDNIQSIRLLTGYLVRNTKHMPMPSSAVILQCNRHYGTKLEDFYDYRASATIQRYMNRCPVLQDLTQNTRDQATDEEREVYKLQFLNDLPWPITDAEVSAKNSFINLDIDTQYDNQLIPKSLYINMTSIIDITWEIQVNLASPLTTFTLAKLNPFITGKESPDAMHDMADSFQATSIQKKRVYVLSDSEDEDDLPSGKIQAAAAPRAAAASSAASSADTSKRMRMVSSTKQVSADSDSDDDLPSAFGTEREKEQGNLIPHDMYDWYKPELYLWAEANGYKVVERRDREGNTKHYLCGGVSHMPLLLFRNYLKTHEEEEAKKQAQQRKEQEIYHQKKTERSKQSEDMNVLFNLWMKDYLTASDKRRIAEIKERNNPIFVSAVEESVKAQKVSHEQKEMDRIKSTGITAAPFPDELVGLRLKQETALILNSGRNELTGEGQTKCIKIRENKLSAPGIVRVIERTLNALTENYDIEMDGDGWYITSGAHTYEIDIPEDLAEGSEECKRAFLGSKQAKALLMLSMYQDRRFPDFQKVARFIAGYLRALVGFKDTDSLNKMTIDVKFVCQEDIPAVVIKSLVHRVVTLEVNVLPFIVPKHGADRAQFYNSCDRRVLSKGSSVSLVCLLVASFQHAATVFFIKRALRDAPSKWNSYEKIRVVIAQFIRVALSANILQGDTNNKPWNTLAYCIPRVSPLSNKISWDTDEVEKVCSEENMISYILSA